MTRHTFAVCNFTIWWSHVAHGEQSRAENVPSPECRVVQSLQTHLHSFINKFQNSKLMLAPSFFLRNSPKVLHGELLVLQNIDATFR